MQATLCSNVNCGMLVIGLGNVHPKGRAVHRLAPPHKLDNSVKDTR